LRFLDPLDLSVAPLTAPLLLGVASNRAIGGASTAGEARRL